MVKHKPQQGSASPVRRRNESKVKGVTERKLSMPLIRVSVKHNGRLLADDRCTSMMSEEANFGEISPWSDDSRIKA